MSEIIGDKAGPIDEDWIVDISESQMKCSRFYLESSRESIKISALGKVGEREWIALQGNILWQSVKAEDL